MKVNFIEKVSRSEGQVYEEVTFSFVIHLTSDIKPRNGSSPAVEKTADGKVSLRLDIKREQERLEKDLVRRLASSADDTLQQYEIEVQ